MALFSSARIKTLKSYLHRMLTFFRRIRKGLLDGGRTSKYLLYAIGEIALVMIGILLALQVNNWNQNRLSIKVEISVLKALRGELSANEVLLADCISNMDTISLYLDTIRMYLGPAPAQLADSTLNIWFGQVGTTFRCFPNTEVLKDVTSSGKMATIRNEDIRLSLGVWSSILENLKSEVITWNDEFSNIFYPYTYKWISWDDVDYYSDPYDPINFKTRFNMNPKLILNELEFQNVLSIHYWRIRIIVELEQDLLTKTEEIVQMISSELESTE